MPASFFCCALPGKCRLHRPRCLRPRRQHHRSPANQYPERIRLSGIDCHEKGQAYGKRAKQAASALAYGKEVTLQTHGKDRHKRILGDVILPDGTNVNHALVKEGCCWWYRRYAPGDIVLEKQEREAREAKRGLWVDPHPVPPWEWRSDKTFGR
ncbi:MAG TPA: thermonuclease family protein [Nitrospiraceae bacterium]|nr:thermonuclease family protein [Nitrospiraceae bacterium]